MKLWFTVFLQLPMWNRSPCHLDLKPPFSISALKTESFEEEILGCFFAQNPSTKMAEVETRDPIIKLFGKTIAMPLNHVDKDSDCKFVSSEATVLHEKVTSCEELVSEKRGNDSAKQITDQTTSEISENPSIEKEISSPKATKKEEQSETSMSHDNKTSKKPDKILPCPRCNSMDTKFCYYNNYNVNQPRHFCKNCQRYWTAGGTMRNVPVGAGRRKNKSSSSSHFQQLIIPDGGVHRHQFLRSNGTFLTFGSDSSISDSQNCNPNGDDHSSKSSITASNSSEKRSKITSQKSAVNNVLPFPPQLQSFNGFPIAPPPFFPPGIPVYYPAPPYWTVINHKGQNSLTKSSVLGKRLRDGEIFKQSNREEPCIWNPKTLKMVDPNESAKSSIFVNTWNKQRKS